MQDKFWSENQTWAFGSGKLINKHKYSVGTPKIELNLAFF